MSFKEVKTNIDQEYSCYGNYRDNSVGRVLHYFYHYFGLHVADSIQVGNKQVTYFGKVIANINWDNGYPLFTFTQMGTTLSESQINTAKKRQDALVVVTEEEKQ